MVAHNVTPDNSWKKFLIALVCVILYAVLAVGLVEAVIVLESKPLTGLVLIAIVLLTVAIIVVFARRQTLVSSVIVQPAYAIVAA